MGIISTLLTGGALIGKVCQSLTGAFTNMCTDEETGMTVVAGDLSIAKVDFFTKSESDGSVATMAHNGNVGYDVSMVFPNDEAGNGVAYDIPATEVLDVTGDFNGSHAPDKEVLIGPCCETVTTGARGAARNPVMKLSLNNMKVGGEPVDISDYHISCDTSGIKIKSDSRALGSLSYLDMTSNTGLMLNSQADISAEKEVTAFEGGAREYSYNIALDKYGLKKGDVLSGRIQVQMGNANGMLTAHDSSRARPLTAAEERCLRKLGVIRDAD